MTTNPTNTAAVPPDALVVAGWVFDIAKFALQDGPGIRTTVFLKGCPLRCAWCHNPESVRMEPELAFYASRCVACGLCVEACQQGVHRIEEGRHLLEHERCVACGGCSEVCPAMALELSGRRMTAAEVVRDVLTDRPFFDDSGGGVTISGGEPMQQFAFTLSLLVEAKRRGLHTCLDTSGFAPWDRFAALLPWVDLFLFDIKELAPDRHRQFTGVSNEAILSNLGRLVAAGTRVRLRLPLVPGMNATPEHLRACGALVASLPGLEAVEVIPFHRLGQSKTARFGSTPPAELDGVTPPSDATVDEWLHVLRTHGAPQARRA